MIFSVSVDLDGLGCYAAIHGLDAGALSERELQAVPVAAVSRLSELFSALRLRATFFAIGGEMGIPGSGRALRAAADAGHEVGSHSHAHDYALSRRPAAEIDADLERAEGAILEAVGKAPRGFRAPGYTLSRALLEAVRARGYLYDSSLLRRPTTRRRRRPSRCTRFEAGGAAASWAAPDSSSRAAARTGASECASCPSPRFRSCERR